MKLDRYFQKGELIPAIVQEAGTGEVLMLAYILFYGLIGSKNVNTDIPVDDEVQNAL